MLEIGTAFQKKFWSEPLKTEMSLLEKFFYSATIFFFLSVQALFTIQMPQFHGILRNCSSKFRLTNYPKCNRVVQSIRWIWDRQNSAKLPRNNRVIEVPFSCTQPTDIECWTKLRYRTQGPRTVFWDLTKTLFLFLTVTLLIVPSRTLFKDFNFTKNYKGTAKNWFWLRGRWLFFWFYAISL